MLDWLHGSATPVDLDWKVLAVRLLLAMVFGLLIAGVFAASQRRPQGQSLSLATTLVLLTVLVAMTTVVIGDSVARAFGLVGALSIVRFRTVVEDTRDTSFVIFAVVVGMALGAGNLLVCLLGVPIVSVMALALSMLGNGVSATRERTLEVRIAAGREPDALLADVFNQELQSWKLLSVVSTRQGTSIEVVYRVRLRDPSALVRLVQAIQALEGVQNVELKKD
jgi:uncharacterized membrane protein YhiD involved in acid resistance